MILAAGRGDRMRPLTDVTPKPLLAVGGKPLIVWQIERLRAAGIREIVINTAWLGDQITTALDDGTGLGVHIVYSPEVEALETGGGIATALPLLGADPFIAVSGDVWCDYPYDRLLPIAGEMTRGQLDLHLVMVPNPAFRPAGDFSLDLTSSTGLMASGIGKLGTAPAPRYTFGNIGVYHPRLFAGFSAHTKFPAVLLYNKAIAAGRATGEVFRGRWHNVGTAAQLSDLDAELRAKTHL
jgi:MurNAc alpha-1-phosphate uridylyltransferase